MPLRINPTEYYAPKTIIDFEFIPWIGHVNTLRIKLKTNQQYIDILKPVIHKARNQLRYQIKGENIIQLIETAEAGKLIK